MPKLAHSIKWSNFLLLRWRDLMPQKNASSKLVKIEYPTFDNGRYIGLRCTRNGDQVITEHCPFCRKASRHYHGYVPELEVSIDDDGKEWTSQGHYCSHCHVKPAKIRLPSGKIVSNARGYFLIFEDTPATKSLTIREVRSKNETHPRKESSRYETT